MLFPSALANTFSYLWNQDGNIVPTSSSSSILQKEAFITCIRKRRHLLVAATVFIIISSLYKLRKRISQKQRRTEVKLISGTLPCVGHLLELYHDPDTLINRGKHEAGPIFRIKVGNMDVYVLTGPLIQEMLHSPRRFNGYAGFQIIMPIERALKISYEHKFKTSPPNPRDKDPVGYTVRENFKPCNLGMFSTRIQQGLDQALDDLQELDLKSREKKIIKLKDTVSWIVSQVSCLCLAGTHVGFNKELVYAMTRLAPKISKTALMLSFFPNWIAERVIRQCISLEKELDVIMDSLVPELEKMQQTSGYNQQHKPSFISMVLNIPPKYNGEPRTPKEIAIAFTKVALGSIDTTRDIVIFILYELAYNPALTQELRTEIKKLDHQTPEKVNEIRLLDSILREVLRCKAISLTLLHKTTQDVNLAPSASSSTYEQNIIPRDSLVIAAINDAHTDPTFMIETSSSHRTTSIDSNRFTYTPLQLNQFDPYRYLLTTDDNNRWESTSIGPELLTFGLSAHACPGRYFAAFQVKYIVAELIMRYNISPTIDSDKRPKDRQFLGLTRTPPDIPLVFERFN
ncbi:cytochrome P450 [Circinella umbellata]|nr:cytochrome P450 [Circinella umbellata]